MNAPPVLAGLLVVDDGVRAPAPAAVLAAMAMASVVLVLSGLS